MKLFGTTTSPYVRRVRIVAIELGVDLELVSTATEDGQEQLRQASPLWKVPTIDTGSEILWDSHTIIDWMFEQHGYGKLRKPGKEAKWPEINFITACDAILDSGINLFYLKKDGVDPAMIGYLEKQGKRIAALLAWLVDQPVANDFGYTEIAFVSTIDWLIFRNAYPLDDFAPLVERSKELNQRGSFKTTYPA